MKINQLSKLSGVNAETIRMYRNLGLLAPRQLDNGYYDYSMDDLRNLLHIRKMRGAGLSLENIGYMYFHTDQTEVYNALREEYDALSEEIARLQREQFMLKLTMDHFKIYRDDPSEVVELNVDDDSYSIFYSNEFGAETVEWAKQINFMTQSIRIPREVILSANPPREIPVQIGIGSYKRVLDENHIEIPSQAVLIPKGKYLTVWLTVDESNVIERSQILPLLRYARDHRYRLTGDTTAFLYRVDKSGEKTKFIYRFRARYE